MAFNPESYVTFPDGGKVTNLFNATKVSVYIHYYYKYF